MKARQLEIVVIAGLAILVWPRFRHLEIRLAEPAEPAIAHADTLSEQPLVATQVVQLQPTTNPLPPKPVEDIHASIHLKLHKWLEAQKNGAEDDESQSMQELLAMLADTNAAAMFQSLSAEEQNTPFGMAALGQWMHASPVEAANWIAALPGATADQTGVVAQGWATNCAGLQNYLDQLPDTAWKQNLLREAGSQMSVKNPAEAVKLAEQMSPGDARTSLLQSVACSWVDSDPNSALDWISKVNDPVLREQLTASAVKSYALTEPELAANWLVSSVNSVGTVKDALVNITETWSSKDPATAANWVAQLPEGDIRNSAVNTVLLYWLQTDHNAAVDWIQGLPEGNKILASLN